MGFFGGFFYKNYTPVSQANWCNMTFTAGNLFPSHALGDPSQAPHWDSNPGLQLERRKTFQISYPSPVMF